MQTPRRILVCHGQRTDNSRNFGIGEYDIARIVRRHGAVVGDAGVTHATAIGHRKPEIQGPGSEVRNRWVWRRMIAPPYVLKLYARLVGSHLLPRVRDGLSAVERKRSRSIQ